MAGTAVIPMGFLCFSYGTLLYLLTSLVLFNLDMAA